MHQHNGSGRRLPITVISSPTERTTAITDLILATSAGWCARGIARLAHHDRWKAGLWSTAFGTLAAAGLLGGIVHGLHLRQETYEALWRPLNLALGTTIALFVTGVVYDTWGQSAAQRTLPPMLLTAAGFWAYTLVRADDYTPFLVYQSVGMAFALVAYMRLVWRRDPGAALMAAGVLTTILAAALQVNDKVALHLVWHFDNNGVYHLIQLPGMLLLYQGVSRSLRMCYNTTAP